MTQRTVLNVIAFLLLTLIVACQPVQRQAAPIPTRAVLPSSAHLTLAEAEQIARQYLTAWSRGDIGAMFNLITFTSQDATPFDAFTALYDDANTTLTLESLTFTGNTLVRENDVAIFNYDVTFETRVLGEFTDSNRNLRLVPDAQAGTWRIAWAPGDIFPQMTGGARLRVNRIIPSRANIYDRAGNTLADQNGRVVIVRVIREDIPDYPNCLDALSAATAEPVNDVQAALEDKPPHWLMDVGIIEAQTYIETHEYLEQVCAAEFAEKPVRQYDTAGITANLIGYVGYPDETDLPDLLAAGFDQESIIGKSGIEASWDETLRGQPGGQLVIVTPDGEVLREITRSRSAPPQSLWLTLDLDLQRYAVEILTDAFNSAPWGATSGGASIVVMDVNTGAVLAMASYPTFNNNAFTPFPPMGQTAAAEIVEAVQEDELRPQLNRPALGVYQLGSVMKTVSAVAVTDSGVYALDERYTCTGIWNRDITRYDWLAGGHGTVTVASALTQSCNPFFYEVGYQLDTADPYLLPRYAREVGFGEATGIGDIAEADGLIPDPEWLRVNYGYEWTFSEAVNISIGQGFMQVTPLQVVRWFGALANGGTLYRPQLVEKVGLIGENPSYEMRPEVTREIDVRPAVLAMEREGLCAVTTSPQGTAEFVFRNSPLQALGVCGKTGTAQSPGEGDPPHAWFGAFAPRDEPEIAVIAMVETSGEGSEVAAPIARDVMEYYFFRGQP